MTEQEQRRCCQRSSAGSGAFAGLVILTVGVILLLDRMGIVHGREILKYWPLALVAAGAFNLVNDRESRAWGVLLIVVGGVLSLRPLGVADVGFRELWPVLLIAAGALLLWGSIQGRRGMAGMAFGDRRDISSPDLDEIAVFGGGERRITSADFRGGRVRAVFGGWEIDLSRAAMKTSEAYIDVLCAFGGVELRVPEDWEVTVRAVALLGGVGDNTRHPRPEQQAGAKRLIITGSVIFGGLELKN